MRNVWLSLGLVVLWALVGWTQCSEIPYTVGGTTVTLKFCGNLTVSGGTCSQVASNVVQCSVPEGTTGTVNLSAQRTPAGTVSISATVLPGWASFTSVSGWGSVSGQCRFTVPTGTAGQRFELKFQASASGVPSTINLTVILDVVRGYVPPPPPEPQIYGPYTGTTDDDGRFTVPIPDLPNNVRVGGMLTECTVRTLARTPVTIYVATPAPISPPSFGYSGFVWAAYPTTLVAQQAPSISYILISAPGYPQMKVTPFRVIPIIVGGMTYTMVDLGTVSFPSPTCQTQPRDGAITGRTDGEGKFTVNVGSGTTVSGRLTECTVKPLSNQTFTVTPVFSEGELSEVRFVVPGYPDTTVTKALSVFHLGAVTYVNLGDVCLTLAAKPDLRLENLCLVTAPVGSGKTFYDVYPWRLGELDGRLHPESPRPSPLPTWYLVAVQLDVVNDGDGLVRELPVVELVVLDSAGRALSCGALAVTVVRADMPQKWQAEGVIEVDLKGAMPTSLPTFRLIADPGNKIAEKDETNNEAERGCDPAYRQTRDPEIHGERGVLKENEDGSWVVGKSQELVVRGEGFLGQPLPPPGGTELPVSLRTELVCGPKCPLAIQYEWDFGDGTPKKAGRSVSHTYVRNGRYTITLATLLGDDRRTTTQGVEVTDEPVVTASSQYKRVFVQQVSVPNTFTASVDPNGNTLEWVEWLLNGRSQKTTAYNTRDRVLDTWTYDLGRLQAHPLENPIVVRAIARADDGRRVVGEASLSIPVAAVPSWLEWTLDIRAGQVPLRAHPRDAWVLYETSYVFPYPPIDITFKMPEGVPFFGGKYKFGAKADFSLDLNSLSGAGNVGGEGEVRFEKGGGEWTFSFEGKVTGEATLANIPPINLVAGEFNFSLEGSFSKDLTVSDVPVIGPKVRAAKAIPLIGSAIKWLESRAKVQFGFSVGLGGDVSFTSGEPGRCLAGIDCSGRMSLSGGLKLALELNLEVLKVTPYGGAKLTVSFTAPGKTIGFLDFDSLTLTGTLGISVVVDLWFCEVEKDFSVDFSWRILSPAQGFVTDHETPWTFPVRPYATPGYSTFRGEARAVPELGVTELWLVEEVFPHARPALVRDPALTMVTWTTDDLAKPFPLGREIAYSSSPSVAVMARPRLITNNQLPDSQPVLALDWIGNPVVVWVQHVSPPSRVPETEQDLTPELLAGLEVVYARYDRRTASWGAPTRLTNNAFLEHSPRFLYDARGITGIIWTANTQGELYPDASAPDTLYLARWDGQAFSAPEMLREGDTSLMRAFADLGGRILYVWVEDTDGDWETQGDEELLWSVWDGTRWTPPERLTTNSVDDEWPVLFPTGMGRADVLWVRIEPGAEGREGVLLVRSFGPDGWIDERVLLEGRPIFSFHAARSRDGQVAVVWQELSEQGPDLFSIVCQPGGAECTEPRQLTADPHQESQVSLVFDDGLLTVAFLRTMVEEQTKKVRYTGPDLEDPTIQYTEEEFEITAPVPGPSHLYLLEVRMP